MKEKSEPIEEHLRFFLEKVKTSSSNFAEIAIFQQLLEALQNHPISLEVSLLFGKAFSILFEHQKKLETEKQISNKFVLDFQTESIRSFQDDEIVLSLPKEMLYVLGLLVIYEGTNTVEWLENIATVEEYSVIKNKYKKRADIQAMASFIVTLQRIINKDLKTPSFRLYRSQKGVLQLVGFKKFVIPLSIDEKLTTIIFLNKQFEVTAAQGAVMQVLAKRKGKEISRLELQQQAVEFLKNTAEDTDESQIFSTAVNDVIDNLLQEHMPVDTQPWSLLKKCIEVKANHAINLRNVTSVDFLEMSYRPQELAGLPESEAAVNSIKFDFANGSISYQNKMYVGFAQDELILLRGVLLRFCNQKISEAFLSKNPQYLGLALPGFEKILEQFMKRENLSGLLELLEYFEKKLQEKKINFIHFSQTPSKKNIAISSPILIQLKIPQIQEKDKYIFIEERKVPLSAIAYWTVQELIRFSEIDAEEWISTPKFNERRTDTDKINESRGTFPRAVSAFLNSMTKQDLAQFVGIPKDTFIETRAVMINNKKTIQFRINPLLKVQLKK